MNFNDYPNTRQAPRQTDLRLQSPGQLALVALGVWLAGVVIHPLAVLAPIGVVLLILAGLAYLVRPKAQTMYWRGRQIDLNENPSSPVQRLYRQVFKR